MTTAESRQQELALIIRQTMDGWSNATEEKGWLASLYLESVTVHPEDRGEDQVEFVFIDRRYGLRYGFRWGIPEDTPEEPLGEGMLAIVLASDLEGTLLGCGYSGPDDDDVRWMLPNAPAGGAA